MQTASDEYERLELAGVETVHWSMPGCSLKRRPFPCKAITSKAKPCQAREVYSNGFRVKHGAEGELLLPPGCHRNLEAFEERKARLIQQMRARFDKLKRTMIVKPNP